MTTEAATIEAPKLPAVAAPIGTAVPFTERDAFELSLRKAKVYSSSTLVPAQYQDSIPNCLIALNMAKRIGADELQVMQNLYIVQGKPGWSGQFLIATFNQCGKFTALRFEWIGKQGEKEWGCRAYATEKATGERIVGSWVTWKMAESEGWSTKGGSKWKTMPEQMFMYRAAAFLVRTHAPEIAMGLQTVEELRDVIDVDPEVTHGATNKTDAIAAVLRARQQANAGEVIDAGTGEVTEGEKGPIPPTDKATLPYATVRAQLDSATTIEVLDMAAANIELVVSLPQQKELNEYYKERKAALDK